VYVLRTGNTGDRQPFHVNAQLKTMSKKCMGIELSVQHALLLLSIVIRQIYGYALDVYLKIHGGTNQISMSSLSICYGDLSKSLYDSIQSILGKMASNARF
jgi:hypothetical protein